jgi:hypothetical protein
MNYLRTSLRKAMAPVDLADQKDRASRHAIVLHIRKLGRAQKALPLDPARPHLMRLHNSLEPHLLKRTQVPPNLIH